MFDSWIQRQSAINNANKENISTQSKKSIYTQPQKK